MRCIYCIILVEGMKFLLEILNELREKLDMDANYFYPAIITVIMAIISFVKSAISALRSNKRDRLLELYYKQDSDMFYGVVMMVELFLVFVEAFICLLFIVLIRLLFHINFSAYEQNILLCFLLIIIGFIMARRSLKLTHIRKRILGDKLAKWVIYFPMIIIHLYLITGLLINNNMLKNIFVIILIIFEVIGLTYFRPKYSYYDFSGVRIFIEGGEIIDCKDISNIIRKNNVLIIKLNSKEIRLKYEKISKIEYYGEPLIKQLKKEHTMLKGTKL